MTWNPTKVDCFPIVGEMCIVFDYFLYEVQLQFKPIRASRLDIKSENMTKLEFLLRRTKYMARVNAWSSALKMLTLYGNRVLLNMFEQIAAEATLSPIFEP